MSRLFLSAVALILAAAPPVAAQGVQGPGLGEVLVAGKRQEAVYGQPDRPVIGLTRVADSGVATIAISSDSRDAEVRKKEIHSMLLAAIDRATAAGVEIVTGNFELSRVTRENYEDLAFSYGGRADTNRVDVMVKTPLGGSARTAETRIAKFVKDLPRTGRGAIDFTTKLTLTIINPDQHRDAIVKLIADHVKHYAALFGAEHTVQITGIDSQISWHQIGPSEVFLFIPYRYTIIANKTKGELP